MLDAAKQLFSNLGYDATTTKLIAKKAKVNEALIHRYFESKAGLLISLFLHIKKEAEETDGKYPEGKNLEEELYNFFMCRLKIARDKQKEMRLIISRALVEPELAAEMGKRVCGGGMPGLTERLVMWKERGAIHPSVDIDTVSIGISGYAFVTSFFGQIIFGMDEGLLHDGLKKMARVYAGGLKNGNT